MKILVIGNTGSALELFSWLKGLSQPEKARDLLEWAQGQGQTKLQLEVSHTARATEAIEIARAGMDLIFLDLSQVDIPPKTNLKRFESFPVDERKGLWLLRKIMPNSRCKRRVIVLACDNKSLITSAQDEPLAVAGIRVTRVIQKPITPGWQKGIVTSLVRLSQEQS